VFCCRVVPLPEPGDLDGGGLNRFLTVLLGPVNDFAGASSRFGYERFSVFFWEKFGRTFHERGGNLQGIIPTQRNAS
jgi:hypothetical protein